MLEGGEPDLTTAAKMVLQDWQRGKIPFFVPPPQEGDASQDTSIPSVTSGGEASISTGREDAAMKVIAGIISSQQKMHVPAQKNFFDDDSGEPESENLDEPENETLEEPVADELESDNEEEPMGEDE
ncbi:uncharacterized protein A4U43_C01F9180 [Asparagus officinalis]|uniref:Uncharacterized protein n=1 Tax=Asparagus officinalis TaxID=4686 RepID=A0A5P1FPR2_ASPOF|nr:uncharacterized protein A4U43_C01F9180 [Asparagus officinalis]